MTAHEAQLGAAFDALARIAEEHDTRLRDGLADAMSQMLATIAQVQQEHAEQYQALRKDLREAVELLEWVQVHGVGRIAREGREHYLAQCDAIDALVERLGGGR